MSSKISLWISDGGREGRHNSFHSSTELSAPCQFSPFFSSASQKGWKISPLGNRAGQEVLRHLRGLSHVLYHLQCRMAHQTLIFHSPPSHSVLSSLQESQAQKATRLAGNFNVESLTAEGLGQNWRMDTFWCFVEQAEQIMDVSGTAEAQTFPTSLCVLSCSPIMAPGSYHQILGLSQMDYFSS